MLENKMCYLRNFWFIVYHAGVSVEAGDQQFSPTIEPQMT